MSGKPIDNDFNGNSLADIYTQLRGTLGNLRKTSEGDLRAEVYLAAEDRLICVVECDSDGRLRTRVSENLSETERFDFPHED